MAVSTVQNKKLSHNVSQKTTYRAG